MSHKLRPAILIALLCALTSVPSKAVEGPVATAVRQTSDRHVELMITNNYRLAITAYVVQFQVIPEGGGVHRSVTTHYVDSLVNPWGDKPVAPGESLTLRFGGPQSGPVLLTYKLELRAALFADGTGYGLSSQIVEGRKTFLQELGKAIRLLQDARASAASRDDLIERADELKKSDMPEKPTVEERRAVDNVFGTVRANLQQRGPNVPLDRSIQVLLDLFSKLRAGLLASKPEIAPAGTGVDPNGP